MTGTLRPVRHATALLAAGAALALALGLAGCTGATPHTPPSASAPSTSAPSGSAAPTESPGDASDNIVYFDSLIAAVLAANPAADGRAYVDALAAGGFDKAQMEVTFDRTSADLAADSVQFSVRVNEECLIGQNGPATGGYHSTVTGLLGSGTCLVGATRQIDW